MTRPRGPSPGQYVRWTPAGRAQEAAQQLWGQDAWVVVHVREGFDRKPTPTFAVVAPVDGGRLRRGFAQTLLLAQIEGYEDA